MGRKSNRQLIKEQLDEGLTVNQLIEHLKTLPAGAYVGKAGHYGEANLMTKYDFSSIRSAYLKPNGVWKNGEKFDITILDIYPPDIGPNPD